MPPEEELQHPLETGIEALIVQNEEIKETLQESTLLLQSIALDSNNNDLERSMELKMMQDEENHKELVSAVKELQPALSEAISNIPQPDTPDFSETNSLLSEMIEEIKKKEDIEIEIDEETRGRLKGDKGDKGDRGEIGPIGERGRDGIDGIDGKTGARGPKGDNGSPDTAKDIKTKLESLEGDERLDAKAIKGLDKLEKKVKGIERIQDNYVFGSSVASNGVPQGGSAGQILAKKTTGVDYDSEWIDNPAESDTLQSVTDRGATTDNIITVPGVQFDTTAGISVTEGQMAWNATDETIDIGMPDGITLQVGQENQIKVRNNTGSTLLNGRPVYTTGMLGNRPTVAYAQSNTHATGHLLGLLTQDIANNADGKVTTSGYVRNLDTTGTPYGETWNDGDDLWVSKTTAGYLTNVEPSAPHHSDLVGQVVNAHATQGSILVHIRQHQALEELSDVNGTALTTDGQLPVWSQTNGFFDFNYNITDYALAADYVPKNDSFSVLSIDSDARTLHDTNGDANIGYGQPGYLTVYNDVSTGVASLYFPEIGSGFYLEGNTSSNAVGVGNVDYFYFNSRLEAYQGILSNYILVNETSPYDNSCSFEVYGKGGFWDANGNLAYFATGTEAAKFSSFYSGSYVNIIDNNNGAALSWEVPGFWGGTLSGSGGAGYFYDTIPNEVYICDGMYSVRAAGNAAFGNDVLFSSDGGGGYYFTLSNGIFSDPNGESVNFTSRTLLAQSSVLSLDYHNRKAYAPDGTTVQLDYSLAGALSAGGAGTPVNDSIFIGLYTGLGATNAINSFFAGVSAGEGATDARNAVFVGGFSGYGAIYAQNSNFFGYQAGYLADSAEGSNFFGSLTGQSAYNAYFSNFFGYTTGTSAINAIQSNFFGTFTGYQATNAKNSIFIGSYTGYQDKVNNLAAGAWSIAIGPYTGTGGFSNSMVLGRGSKNSNITQANFGNALFLNGIYNSNTQSSIPISGGTAVLASATTDIGNIGSLGAEKLANGTFTGSATSWTLGTGWAYSSNTVVKNADGTGTLSQAVGSMVTQFVVGEMYYVTFTSSSHTVGSFTPTVGGVTLPTINLTNANQTFGYFFTATSNTALTFTPTNTSRFYLDNISIKKITGGNLNVAGTANVGAITSTGSASLTGSLTLGYRAITALRTLDATDYLINCTANSFTVTLPTAASITGRTYIVKNSGTGIITVATTSSQTIDGVTTQALSQYDSITVVSNGTNWLII